MNLIDVLGPFVILVVMIAAVAGIYLRQGRNRALERLILQPVSSGCARARHKREACNFNIAGWSGMADKRYSMK